MLTLIIRSIIIYTLVLFVFRIMGKRQIGQMQPFELVMTLIVADLATIPMAEISIPFLHGVIPLVTLVLLHFLITWLSHSSIKFGLIINGKPVIIINPLGIDYNALKRLSITIDDLLEGMRNCGYFSFEQVQYAIMETTGKISVIPKSDYSTVTLQDLKIKAQDTDLPVTIISEGSFMVDNAKLAGVDKEFISNILKREKINKLSKVLILTINKAGQVYLQEKFGKFKLLETSHKGEVKA